MPPMRVQSVVLAGLLCLFTAAASADIVRISPSVLPIGAEDFITIYGEDLLGTVSTTVVFDDGYEIEPSDGLPGRLIVYIPTHLTFEAGRHTLAVHANDGTSVRIYGPVTFSIEAPPASGPPILGLPETLVEEAETANGVHVIFNHYVNAISSSGDPLPIDCTPSSGSHFPMGTSTVQCSATDAGGTSTGSFSIFVTDTVAPVLTVPGEIITADPVVTFTATAVDEIDGDIPVTCSPASGSTFPDGNTRVRCTATDSHANSATDFFMVRVTGGAPLITVPDDLEVEATSAAGAVVTYAASAVDATTFSCAPASGSTFPLGSTTVTCTASNAAGTSTASFVVTVADNTGPVLTMPSLLEVEATSPAGAVATYVVTAMDAVDGSRPVDCVPASGTFFAFGTTTVFCSAFDLRGNETAGSFDVVVQDTTAPTFTAATVNPGSLWPPNHKMVPITVTAQATDAVDPAPSIAIVSVSSNQPVNGTGDGDAAPDWEITGPLALQLRAERAGNSERIYTITIAATDLYGNVATTTVEVRVGESKKAKKLR